MFCASFFFPIAMLILYEKYIILIILNHVDMFMILDTDKRVRAIIEIDRDIIDVINPLGFYRLMASSDPAYEKFASRIF